MSKTSKETAGGRKHRRCPVTRSSCVCLIPQPVFYVCCGSWCARCLGYVKPEFKAVKETGRRCEHGARSGECGDVECPFHVEVALEE